MVVQLRRMAFINKIEPQKGGRLPPSPYLYK